MHDYDHTPQTPDAPPQRTKRLSIEVDFERHAHFLENSGMSEAQKRECLQALWEIAIGFVDLGFPLETVRNSSGKLALDFAKSRSESANAV